MSQTKSKLLDPLSFTFAPLNTYQRIKQKQATVFFYQYGDRYFVVTSASIASVYPTPFNGNPFFLVDARVFQGNSGSPVITKPTSLLVKESGNELVVGKVSFLVGVLSHTWPIYEGKEHLGLNAVWFSSLVEKLTSL